MSLERGGVPVDEATAHDFMMIRAALVRRLGSANAALAWTRVHFRSTPANPDSYEHGGHRWWRANRDVVSDETGLTPSQARRTLEQLVEMGALIAEQHHLEGKYDQTKSYRCNVVARAAAHVSDLTNEGADLTDGRSDLADVHRADLTNLDRADLTNPSSKNPQEGRTTQSSRPLTYPGARGGTRAAGTSYAQAGDSAVDTAAIVEAMRRFCGRDVDVVDSYGIVGIVLDRRGDAPLGNPTAYVVAAIERDPIGWQAYADTRRMPA